MQSVDAECAAAAVAPRVSLADIEASIVCRFDMTGTSATVAATAVIGPRRHTALETLSICILVLKNGWTVVGTAAPVSRENFDAARGRQLAYEDCLRRVWPLLGFALCERLAAMPAYQPPGSSHITTSATELDSH